MRTFYSKLLAVFLIVALTLGFTDCASILNPKREKKEMQKKRSGIAKKKRAEIQKGYK